MERIITDKSISKLHSATNDVAEAIATKLKLFYIVEHNDFWAEVYRDIDYDFSVIEKIIDAISKVGLKRMLKESKNGKLIRYIQDYVKKKLKSGEWKEF